ncbi:copper-binding protein [Azospirillum largimobile]
MHKIATAALIALLSLPVAAMAQMSHDHAAGGMPATAAPANGTTGKVNTVDPAKHTINLTHGPIQALGWPAMTMDFGVASTVDLATVKPGDTVAFTVGKDAKGVYQINSMKTSK